MALVRTHIDSAKASTPREGFIPNPKLKLLDQVSEVMRFKHYSIRTETTYRECIKHFIFFHGKRHPQEMVGLVQPLMALRLARSPVLSIRTPLARSLNAILDRFRQRLHDHDFSVSLGQIARPAAQEMTTSKSFLQPHCTCSLSSSHNPMNDPALRSNMSAGLQLDQSYRCRLYDTVIRSNPHEGLAQCRDQYHPVRGHRLWSCRSQVPTAVWLHQSAVNC